MPEKSRIPFAQAEELALEVVELVGYSCERIAIAGSIRRRKADVGDVELVCVPRFEVMQADLFAPGEGLSRDLLSARCVELLADWTLAHRLDVNGHAAFGPKFKRLLYGGFPLDLFSPPAECWGVVYCIRTGPAEFSHRLVTPRRQGGLCPDFLRFRDGRVWHEDGTLYDTPEEADVFARLGVPFVPPEERV